ncbi:hypothetical protein [Micromonospora thermarum]|uniref:Uncharacterized protein n=1 Tax=Micromonospora thermarum TaxID=2720024 RepID=A0ABX0YZ48_9ACTN|nr:hypothetical protein [Micromonospora thermarum]NJP30767.1 hypothetical protein [Micromonospora thermarum]
MPDVRPLSDLVLDYLAERPGHPLKPHEITRGINAALDGRHVGASAVTNRCLRAAATGHLVQVTEMPMAFAYPTGPITTGEGHTEQS